MITAHFIIHSENANHVSKVGFLLGFFSGGAKSIVVQISFVMLLFLDQISGRGKSFQGGANCLRGVPCPPVEESQKE